jgi:8-oxo-dGTP diphosphatase
MTFPDPADRWTFCREGHIHWGAIGGAGLLLCYLPRHGQPPVYLLTERSRWVDEGGTWGIPGGAIHYGESPEQAARREAAEEIWPVPSYRVMEVAEQDCGGGWRFHIVRADVDATFTAYCARQTDATGWFSLEQMRTLRLHPGFRRWVDEHQQPVE